MKRKFTRQDQSKHTEQFSYTRNIIDTLSKNIGAGFPEYRKRLDEAAAFNLELDYPVHIDFETIFGCNIKCIMCTHSHRDLFPARQRFLEFDLFKKVIDEGVQKGLSSIGIDQEGDPLLVDNLTDFIGYARGKGILDIIMNTNALALDKEKTERLLHSGLTRIHFSLDAITEETYDGIRRGSDFKKVMENIQLFLKRKAELGLEVPITRVSFVRMKANEHELDRFVEFWSQRVDAIAVQEYNAPFPEQEDLSGLRANNRIGARDFKCTQPWFRMVILTDGTVLPCCLLGMSLKMAIGNAYNESIYDLWNSESMKRLRKLHREGRYYEHEICKICAENFV